MINWSRSVKHLLSPYIDTNINISRLTLILGPF